MECRSSGVVGLTQNKSMGEPASLRSYSCVIVQDNNR